MAGFLEALWDIAGSESTYINAALFAAFLAFAASGEWVAERSGTLEILRRVDLHSAGALNEPPPHETSPMWMAKLPPESRKRASSSWLTRSMWGANSRRTTGAPTHSDNVRPGPASLNRPRRRSMRSLPLRGLLVVAVLAVMRPVVRVVVRIVTAVSRRSRRGAARRRLARVRLLDGERLEPSTSLPFPFPPVEAI